MSSVIGIIPARLASTRFPAKPLKMLAGFPIIRHVYSAASKCTKLSEVWVATDDNNIADIVKSFGGKVVMTDKNHTSGTDRIVEAIDIINSNCDMVVNIQGDEPLIRPGDIDKCVSALSNSPEADWATLIYKLDPGFNASDPNTVKVVCNTNNFALYFSRAAIPFDREKTGGVTRYGHIGLYVYKTHALKQFAELKPTPLEKYEKLEQLRALESGMNIVCVNVDKAYPGIDTPEDLISVENIIKQNPGLLNIQ